MRAESYDEYLLGLGRSAKTVGDYRRELELAVGWFNDRGLSLSDATPSQLVEYASTRPNTPAIRAHLRSALAHYWDWLGVDGWPAAIKVPRPAPAVCKALTTEEARDLVKTSIGWWREGAAVLVGCYLGLRNEEIAGMRWDGFDPDLGWYTLVGKGNRQRTIPVHPILAQELHGRQDESPWVFAGRHRGHVTHATIWNWVNKVAAAAGIKSKVWPHRLRHTALATANDNLGDLRAVQAFAGHAKIETTMGYTRTTTEKLRAVSSALDYV